MPQLFQVLKCYKCSVFQVHQTKKSSKWECKLCGEKQSIKRHYGLGSGKECRLHVQKLNGIRGEIDEQKECNELNQNSDEELENNTEKCKTKHILDRPNKESKWSNFIDKTDIDLDQKSNDNENMMLGNIDVVLEVPAKKRRKFKTPKVIEQPMMMNDNDITKTNEPEYHQINSLIKYDSICLPINSNICSKINSSKIKMFDQLVIPKKVHQPICELNVERYNKNYNGAKKSNIQDNDNSIKTYIPPKLNKNSKWAQFAEPDDKENDVSISRENSSDDKSIDEEKLPETVTKNLFTLCDESELDDVLNI